MKFYKFYVTYQECKCDMILLRSHKGLKLLSIILALTIIMTDGLLKFCFKFVELSIKIYLHYFAICFLLLRQKRFQ